MTDPSARPGVPRDHGAVVVSGINGQTVPGASLADLLAGAVTAGFDGVELTGESIKAAPFTVKNRPTSTRLRVFGVSPTTDLHDWHWRWTPTVEAGFVSELDAAARIGAEYFVMPFMRDAGDAESIATGLRKAVPIAADLGLRLAVEPIGHHAVLSRAQELGPVLRRFDPERVGVLIDSFHWFRAGQSVEDLIHYDGVPIQGIQVSNANERPIMELLGYRDRTFPLNGPFDVTGLCRRVLEGSPQVPVIVEVIGDVARSTPTTVALRTARAQLDEIGHALTTKERSLG